MEIITVEDTSWGDSHIDLISHTQYKIICVNKYYVLACTKYVFYDNCQTGNIAFVADRSWLDRCL